MSTAYKLLPPITLQSHMFMWLYLLNSKPPELKDWIWFFLFFFLISSKIILHSYVLNIGGRKEKREGSDKRITIEEKKEFESKESHEL